MHKEDLLTKKSNLSPDIFISAKILKTFTRNELDEAEHRREQDAEKRETIQAILGQLAKKDSFLMTPDEFDAQFDPYKEKWPDLREMFLTHYTRVTGRTGLPAVLTIGEDYLYRDHLYPLFKARHREASVELREYYLNLAERILRTNNKDRNTAYTGLRAFREDIREQLTSEFPVLSDMLSKPRIVSEGIIHYSTKVLKVSDMERVKSVLEKYFESGSIRFMHADKLFELIPGELFEEAFRRLSWFRRLILKLFGRYDSYLQTLNMENPVRTGKSGRPTPGTPSEAPDSGRVRPYRPSMTLPAEGDTVSAVRRSRQAVNPRRYSMKQQDQAWDEFKSAYEKKKTK